MRVVPVFLAAIVLVLAGLWWALGHDEASGRAAMPHATQGPPSARSDSAPSETVVEREPAPSEAPFGRRASSEVGVPALDDGPGPIQGEHRVVARAVDPWGEPIAGATLVVGDSAPVAARPNGTLEWRGALAQAPGETLRVVVGARGFARRTLERRRPDGATTWLGDVDLKPGARIVGRTVDQSGLAVAGATLHLISSRAGEPALESDIYDSIDRSLRSRLSHSPRATSDTLGRFVFDGVEPGAWRLWANSWHHRWSVLDGLEPDGGDELDIGDVALLACDPFATLRGRVLAPDGSPAAGVPVVAHPVDGGVGDSATSDELGRFRLHVGSGKAARLEAQPPVWDWHEIDVEGVLPGPREVELRFGEPSWLWARVRDVEGRPIVRGRVQAERPGQPGRRLGRSISDLWDDGRARLHAPREPFVLVLQAPGWVAEPVGPFEPGANERPIEIVARPVPALRGRVLEGERGVGGIALELHLEPGELSLRHMGWTAHGAPFDYLATHWTHVPVSSQPGGAFALPLPFAIEGACTAWLVARRDARAAAVLGPIEVTARGLEDLRLELRAPGAIVGTLTLDHGPSPAGWTVRASDGLGTHLESVCDAAGAFALGGAHEGAWQVRAFAPGAAFRADARLTGSFPSPIWDVELQAGERVRFDLRVESQGVRVVGRLALTGSAQPITLGQWTVRATRADLPEADALFAGREAVAPDGRFYLRLPAPGRYGLALSSEDPRWGRLVVMRTFDFQSDAQELELTLPLGRFEVAWPNAPSALEGKPFAWRRLVLEAKTDDDSSWMSSRALADGTSGWAPVGEVTWRVEQIGYPDDAGLAEPHAAQVPHAGALRLELP
ncbi:MAG TPA: carboxypeptidase-like regulatory domain-containing protein [Planctomycetota bacterium]|nr:carboxypeptidase-like regulatory domain-containing protein [Planctomycetota bacterium]